MIVYWLYINAIGVNITFIRWNERSFLVTRLYSCPNRIDLSARNGPMRIAIL